MYNFTFKKRFYKISGFQFFIIFSLMIGLFVTSLIGLYRLGGFALILGAGLLTSYIKIDDKIYALIKHEKTRSVISGITLWSGVGYFIYTTFFVV